MTKILRTPTRAEGGITPEEKAKMDVITKKWIERAFFTGHIDKEKITDAIERLYAAANLKKPRVVIVQSPLMMANVFALASCILKTRGIATRDVTEAATLAETYDVTRGLTDDKTYAMARDLTYDTIRAVTRDVTRGLTDATRDVTLSATCDAIRDVTCDLTHGATRGLTDDKTYAMARDLTYYTTRDVTLAATCAATYDATDATLAATDPKNLLPSLAKTLNVNYAEVSRARTNWWSAYQGGNMWAAFCAFAEAFRDVLGLTGLDCWEANQAWEDAAWHGGFRIMQEDYCIVSDFPEILKVNEKNQPHCVDGPSHRWRDGFEIYHLWGIRFTPEEWKMWRYAPASVIMKIENTDKRAALIRAIGAEKIIAELGGKVIGKDEYSEVLELEGMKDGNGDPYRFLKALDPAHNQHVFLRIPPNISEPKQAEAWTYDLEVYAPLFRV